MLPEKSLEKIEDLLAALAEVTSLASSDEVAAVRDALDRQAKQVQDQMVRTLDAEREAEPDGAEVEVPVTLDQILSRHLRHLRTEAGWTQERLASSMAYVGLKWKRVTVADSESGRRPLTLEEIAALAILFGEPMVNFLTPPPGGYVDLPFKFVPSGEMRDGRQKELVDSLGGDPSRIPAESFRALFFGQNQEAFEGGDTSWKPGWEMYGRLDCAPMVRPARDYWEKRQSPSYETDAD